MVTPKAAGLPRWTLHGFCNRHACRRVPVAKCYGVHAACCKPRLSPCLPQSTAHPRCIACWVCCDSQPYAAACCMPQQLMAFTPPALHIGAPYGGGATDGLRHPGPLLLPGPPSAFGSPYVVACYEPRRFRCLACSARCVLSGPPSTADDVGFAAAHAERFASAFNSLRLLG